MSETILTQDRLKELLEYDRDTGVFTWRVCTPGGGSPGRLAGFKTWVRWRESYVSTIQISGAKYEAQDLAWFYVHGWWSDFVCHLNGNTMDNRLANIECIESDGFSSGPRELVEGYPYEDRMAW